MSYDQAKYLLNLVEEHGGKLSHTPDKIRIANHASVPLDVLEQIRANKAELLEYLTAREQRYFERLMTRALDGYHWLYKRREQQHRANRIPITDIRIETQQWRDTVAKVIGLNAHEVALFEQILTQQGDLILYDGGRYVMSRDEYENPRHFLPDDDSGEAFRQWLETGRFFWH